MQATQVQTKKCKGCGLTKVLSEYCKNNKAKDGLFNKCRTCTGDIRKQRVENYRVSNKTNNIIVSNKYCSHCDTVKNADEFNKNRNTKDGLGSYCKTCVYSIKRKDKERYSLNCFLYRQREKRNIIQKYGGKCCCCGQTGMSFLNMDHINNDGSAHRKVVRGNGLYGWLKRNGYPKDNFQLLCASCNHSKMIHGKCIHELAPQKTIMWPCGATL